MKSISKNQINEIIINKSKFITLIYPIKSKEDISNILKDIKETYKDATHYCYGYILDNIEKCDDNGEPSGTAGMPILKVLKYNNLTDILCVVVRYFGGIKLGAGGLIRAYSNSTSEILNKCEIKEIKEGYEIKIILLYDNIKQIDYILKNININKTYDKNVIYKFNIEKSKWENIEKEILKYSNLESKKPVKLV